MMNPSSITCWCGAPATAWVCDMWSFVYDGVECHTAFPRARAACDEHGSKRVPMICPVCREQHGPKRWTNNGPACCYHCGQTPQKCGCYPGPVTKLYRALKAWVGL